MHSTTDPQWLVPTRGNLEVNLISRSTNLRPIAELQLLDRQCVYSVAICRVVTCLHQLPRH